MGQEYLLVLYEGIPTHKRMRNPVAGIPPLKMIHHL